MDTFIRDGVTNVKSIAIVLLCATRLLAQRSDTIVQTLATNTSVNPFTSSPVQNIGQYSHQLVANLSNRSGQTCPAGMSLQLQGSFDNVLYLRMPQRVVNSNITQSAGNYAETKIVQGFGSYPYIRASLSAYDQLHCQVTLNYSGNVNPISPIKPADNIVIPGTDIVQGPFTGTTTNLFLATNGDSPSLYALQLYCPTATTTVSLTVNTDSPAFTQQVLLSTGALAANSTISLPYTGIPYFRGAVSAFGSNGYFVLTTTGGTCNGSIIGKVE